MKQIFLALLTVCCSIGAAQSEEKEPREGGILGTGIVGTITGLGSIYVNGQHIHFDADLDVGSSLGPRKAGTLVPGETVSVRAVKKQEIWQAEQITLYYPLIGPLRMEDGALFVMGSKVDDQNAEIITSDGLSDGDWISVSGIWQRDGVSASRIEEIAAKPRAILIGSYIDTGEGTFVIGGTTINQISPTHVTTGDVLTIQGTPSGVSLDATNVKIGLFEEPVSYVIAQGFLSVPDSQGLYTVLGSGVVSFTDTPDQITGTEYGIFCNIKEQGSDRYIMTEMAENCE